MAVLEKKEARDQLMLDLAEQSKEGGVKGMKARLLLDGMHAEDELARNKAEINAGASKRKEQKAVDNGDPFVEEQKRLAKEKAEKVSL